MLVRRNASHNPRPSVRCPLYSLMRLPRHWHCCRCAQMRWVCRAITSNESRATNVSPRALNVAGLGRAVMSLTGGLLPMLPDVSVQANAWPGIVLTREQSAYRAHLGDSPMVW
jgi:hypothetical protein